MIMSERDCGLNILIGIRLSQDELAFEAAPEPEARKQNELVRIILIHDSCPHFNPSCFLVSAPQIYIFYGISYHCHF